MISAIQNRTGRKQVFYVLMSVAICLMLASCAPESTTTPVLATSTLAAAATRTQTPTSELTNTPQPTATKTPQATMTPNGGGIFVGPYDFPDWVSDPETEVLLTPNGGKYTLINATTFEIFNLPFELNTVGWMPNGKQLLVNRYFNDVYIINTINGEVEHLTHDQYVQLTTAGYLKRYYWTSKKSDTYWGSDIFIINRENGEVVYHSDGDKILRDQSFSRSPVESLIRIYRNPQNPLGRENCECEVVIFDPRSQEFVFIMQGDFVNFRWSPDGSKMLYIRQSPDGALGDRLCIMEWRSETEICYRDGRSWHGGRYIYTPQWLPNGNSISYIYWLPGVENQIGGLCMIALDDNQITCPELVLPAGFYPEDAYRWVVGSQWSPSSEMVLIYHGCPECTDYIDLRYLNYEALVAIDGSRFFLLPKDPNNPDRGRYSWRPALSP